MALTLNQNFSSIKVARHLFEAKSSTNEAIERISSGKKLNSAMDDAAGVGISSKLMSQVRGMNMSIRSAQDGIAAAQIADAALVEVQNITVRIKELAVQKASGQFTDSDRSAINEEINQLNQEIARIAGDTKFNERLVDGREFSMAISGNNTSVTFYFPTFPKTGGTSADEAVEALNTIAEARGRLGAIINRLDHATANLRNISINTETAYSQIVDADAAVESTRLAKGQVLQETAATMLAQANATNRLILELIPKF